MRIGKFLGMGLLGAVFFSLAGSAHPPKEVPSAMTLAEMEAYLTGETAGEALPAETFGYPSPQRVLGLGEPLALTADQKERIQSILKDSRAQAQFFGKKIVSDELFLDNFFRRGGTDFATLYNIVEKIEGWRMRLRLVRLNAHVSTRRILSSEQLKKYHELRAQSPDGTSSP